MKNFNIKIECKNQKDVFILFSALNSMGYNDENNNQGMHPIRRKVRNYLLACNWSKEYPELNKIIKKHHPAQLLIKILQRLSISDFKKFSKEPLIQKLWTKFKNSQEKETKKIFPLFQREVVYLIRFINKKPSDVKKLVLIINLLDAYWRGYGFKIAETGYVIVGPGADKNQGELIRHELLHLLAPTLRLPRRITTGQHHKRLVTSGYISPSVINREYVIRTLNLIYESAVLKMDISKAIKREAKNFPHIRETLTFMKIKKEKDRL